MCTFILRRVVVLETISSLSPFPIPIPIPHLSPYQTTTPWPPKLTHHRRTDFRSRCCRHHWMQIWQPCRPGRGFNTCSMIGDGVARDIPEVVAQGLCPACGASGRYDKNLIRMVMDMKRRWRWGLGPSKCDPGIECAVM
ncbi:hypothetical protein F4677DRAFT_440053 [Hypoxylon crocopeplum]|nr:hypothetical protein F4677DRAFT_440053 [Hypoxylon crocopeplum]